MNHLTMKILQNQDENRANHVQNGEGSTFDVPICRSPAATWYNTV